MEDNLGAVLKELRKKKNLTAKNVSDKLKDMGYSISDKTISGYETGIRMPNADVFMAICQIYDCRNILEMFSFVKAEYSIPTDDEWKMIEKFRSLDNPGKEHIDYELNRECERVKEIENLKKKIDTEFSSEIVPMRVMSYYQKMASAGSGEYLFSEIPTDVIEVPDTTLSRRANFVLGVNGNSMETTYFDGDKVLVEKAQDVPIGAIGVFIREGECFIKEAGKDRLISHNEDKERYPDIIPDERRIDTVGIVLGKVGE